MAVKVPNRFSSDRDEKPLTLHLPPGVNLDDEQLLKLSSLNQDLRLERSSQGDLIVMPPTGGNTGKRNVRIIFQLFAWSQQDAKGEVYDSSTGFRLSNGAVRSPDASWVSHQRLENLTESEQDRFLPLGPDFIIELRSPSDSLSVVQQKMQEYLANGSRLGWLIDPEEKRVYVYTPEGVEELDHPDSLSGEPVLAGFVLDLQEIW